jgi:protein gp37
MQGTGIQWCDDTVNPTMGCDGCELWGPQRKSCYAGVLHERKGGRHLGFAPSFERVTRFDGRMAKAARLPDLRDRSRLDKPWLDGSPRLTFVSDMSDALSSAISFAYLEQEIIRNVTSAEGQRHRWLWLTKRPHRMAEFSAQLLAWGIRWPSNLWAGTSITSAPMTNRIDALLGVGDESTVRFLSVEPQVEPIDLGAWLPRIDWVIQGGESGEDARPFDVAWARALRDACSTTRVPYFLKQLGAAPVLGGQPLRLRDRHGGDWSEWPEDLRRRQVPTVRARGVRPAIRLKALVEAA